MTRPGTAGCHALCWFICFIWLPLSVQNTAGAASDTSQHYGPVQTNETLWRIANRLRPPDISAAQMAIALQQANPHAFANGDIHQLLAGAVLQIPPLTSIHRISPTAAAARLQARSEPPAPPAVPAAEPRYTLPASTQVNPPHTDRISFTSWILWSGSVICCLVILLIGLGAWRKRTREQAYPATFTASATLTPIPVPARAQPDWLAPSGQKTIPVAEVLPAAEDTLTLAPPDVPEEDTRRIAGIQVTEHSHQQPEQDVLQTTVTPASSAGKTSASPEGRRE